jgi:putative membrane protein
LEGLALHQPRFVECLSKDIIMHRRNFVAAAAVLPLVLLTSRAFAQDAKTPAANATPADDVMPAMGEAEMTHAKQTGMVGSLSLLQSRMAVTMASDAKVKMFATWEVAEQETVGDILKSMTMAMDEAQGALMPPTNEEAMAMVDADGEAKLDELKAMSGTDFDKGYVMANLDGHKKLLDVQEEYLKTGTNREHLSVAKLARGMIKEHIDHLTELQSMLG